jgi:L-fuconate dehydratase
LRKNAAPLSVEKTGKEMIRITDCQSVDVRFPTSRTLDGSDAMNPAPDYSAAYAVIRTNQPGLEGHGFTFTIGRGNELCCAAIEALAPILVGRSLESITDNFGGLWRDLVGDSQLRWLGPEKGVVHLAAAAISNALWDLWAKVAGQPVWRLVADLSDEQLVSTIDFRHIRDMIDEAGARELVRTRRVGRQARIETLLQDGFPAYTTSAGWLGYSDEQIRFLCEKAVADGWSALKIKVGRDLQDDLRRIAVVRDVIGPERLLMIDANQVWEVEEAKQWVSALADFSPYWIEEPISPDDILGHAAIAQAVRPVRIATGEHCSNRVMFKQFLQSDAIDVVQLDACRLGGLNEALAVMLMAAKFDKPICPHAGGVGLCENAQHLSMIDYICIGASMDGRMTEHAAHLHEHFVDPIQIFRGRYLAPKVAGFSADLRQASLSEFAFPNGDYWRRAAA